MPATDGRRPGVNPGAIRASPDGFVLAVSS
jgi:hypothetical protein